jgi:hypothetical protein
MGVREIPVLERIELPESYSGPRLDPKVVARAKQRVRPAALSMIGVGVLALFFNLFIAGFTFVDEFVTPLSTRTNGHQQSTDFKKGVPESGGKAPPGKTTQVEDKPDHESAVMAIPVFLIFAVASVMGIWAGFMMMHLRSYYLSVAGSFAIMPGACFCLLAGIPIGIWSLVLLFKPEIASTFT